MDFYMVKGRGVNRGKYLVRTWVGGAPQFGWTTSQRQACRDSRWCAATLARQHDGWVVKLVASKAIRARVRELKGVISQHAVLEEVPARWLYGDDDEAGLYYCEPCALQRLAQVLAAKPELADEVGVEGWRVEHDSPIRCETCDCRLGGTLTDYGIDRVLDGLEPDNLTADDLDGWADLDLATDLPPDDPRWRRIAALVDAALAGARRTPRRRGPNRLPRRWKRWLRRREEPPYPRRSKADWLAWWRDGERSTGGSDGS